MLWMSASDKPHGSVVVFNNFMQALKILVGRFRLNCTVGCKRNVTKRPAIVCITHVLHHYLTSIHFYGFIIVMVCP